MNLGEFYAQVLLLLGKDQYGGYLSPQEFMSILNNYVQNDFLDALVRLFESTREDSTDLYPFFKSLGDPNNPPLPVTQWGIGGYAAKPSDFYYFARGEFYQFLNNCTSYTVNPRMLLWLDEATFNHRITSELMYPTTREPIATIQNDQIFVVPYVQEIAFTYLRQPADVVFDYDIVSGTIVYLPPGTVHTNSSVLPTGTPSQSVELEWPRSAQNELIRRVVQFKGRNIQSPFDMSMENKKPEP